MSKEPELKARDKVVLRMTREGAVEENLTAGTERRVSKRLDDAELVKPAETAAPSEALSAEEQKKVQMRRQQRQFQAEHAEDNDTQPPLETSVTEEKRADNPPQNAPEPLPSSETSFKPPVLEQHGVSSHTGTVIAETVVTHKLRKTSAVEAVDADAVLTQAAETASAKPVSDDAVPPTKRMQKLERKSEKAHERLDAAREKLPTHKVLKKERVFDEETGKGKTRLHFEDELKKPKGKGKLQFEADKTVRKVGDTLASGIHGKIHEVEQENSAVEAAHKTEIAAETAARLAALGLDCTGAHFTPLPAAKHIFTHIEWHQSGYFLTVPEQPAPAGCVWAGKEQLEAAYTLPGAFKVYKKLLLTKLL